MGYHRPRILLSALVIGLGAALTAPVHAANAPQPAFPVLKGLVAANGITPMATNGLLDADIAIYVSDGSNYTSLAAEGHLQLTPHGNVYTGTFMDDLGDANIFPALGTNVSTTNLNGDYVVNTWNGKFTFHLGTKFTSTVPAKYGPKATVGTILYGAHAYKVNAPLSVSLGSFTIGGFLPPVTGALTLTTDSLGYIVPFRPIRHVNSSFSYVLNGLLHQSLITSYGRYYPPDGSGDGSLTVVLQVGGVNLHIIDAKEDTSKQKIIFGNALTGFGTQTTQASFSAH